MMRGGREALGAFLQSLDPNRSAIVATRTIDGVVPNPLALPQGCRFNPRCPFAVDRCRAAEPPLAEIKPGHFSACWRAPLEQNVL